MKAIILAAGEGTRLRPYTEDRPKCMVEFQNQKIIDWIFQAMRINEIQSIVVITGYHSEVLVQYLTEQYPNVNLIFYHNADYASTNMVETLFCAQKEFDDDVIISYGDIVYRKEVIQKFIETEGEVSVVIDQNWKKLWELRMEDPLQDAETLKFDTAYNIREIGKKPKSYEEIEGQYMGVIKIKKEAFQKVKALYNDLDRNQLYDGQPFQKMYMTTLLQLFIDSGIQVKACLIQGGWVEIDTVEDLKRLQSVTIE